MNIIKTVAAVAAVGILSLGAFVVGRQEAKVVKETVVGSVTNPDLSSPYFSFGGVRRWAANVPLTQNASTTCNIQSPAATSTLVAAAVRFSLASTSAEIVEIGRSTGGYATSTLIGSAYRIDAGAQASIIASTSPAAGDALLFSPNTYFVVKMGGSTGNVPTGACHAVFEEI
jgi:hypothetical protein